MIQWGEFERQGSLESAKNWERTWSELRTQARVVGQTRLLHLCLSSAAQHGGQMRGWEGEVNKSHLWAACLRLWGLIHALITNQDLHSQTPHLSSTPRRPRRRITLKNQHGARAWVSAKSARSPVFISLLPAVGRAPSSFTFPSLFSHLFHFTYCMEPKSSQICCFFLTLPTGTLPPPRLAQ